MPKLFPHHAQEPELEQEFDGVWNETDRLRGRVAELEASLTALTSRVDVLDVDDDGEDPSAQGAWRATNWSRTIEMDQPVSIGTTYEWNFLCGVSASQHYTHGPIYLTLLDIRRPTSELAVEWRFGDGRRAYKPWPNDQGRYDTMSWGDWWILRFNEINKGQYRPMPTWLGPDDPESDWMNMPINSAQPGVAARFNLQLRFQNTSFSRWWVAAHVSGVFHEHYERNFSRPIR